MFILKKLIAAFVLPPNSLLLLIVIGTWLLARTHHRRFGLGLIGSGVLAFTLISLPITASYVIRPLYLHPPISPEQALELPAKAQAIVILAGGAYPLAPEYGTDNIGKDALTRLRYGAWLHRQTKLPVLLTGGSPEGGKPEASTMARILREDYGITARWVEGQSLDTRDNATYSAALLKKEGVDTVVLVTSAFHMRRAMAEFERTPLKVIAAPTGRSGKPNEDAPATGFVPESGAFYSSSLALKEWLGILAIKLRPEI